MTIPSVIDVLLSKEEGTQFETKRVSGKMVGKALQAICAFSNREGGLLVLGMEDPDKAKGIDRLYGLSENLEAVAELKRKLVTHFLPAINPPRFFRIATSNREGKFDAIAVLIISKGKKVHSILDDGTWIREENQNRELTAAEITELSYKRGELSAETQTVDIEFAILDTETFRDYCESRGLRRGTLEHKFQAIGLARREHGKIRPTKTAVLLFADSPSDLLALSGSRAGVRVFHYSGSTIDHSENPNLRKPPKSLAGPVYDLIEKTTAYVMNEIAKGFEMASGFVAKHDYPKRVIKEGITNAILHRDYRYARDTTIRIFNDRIEIESPGEFPANITPATIETAGSAPRNPSLVNHLREFPQPPNVDAGEGVPMIFHEMRERGLYPPNYSVQQSGAVPSVMLRLLNEQRPGTWELVSDFINRHGLITNKDLRKIASLEDTVRASRMLKSWADKGLLVMEGTGKKNTIYRRPNAGPMPSETDLFSLLPEQGKKFIEAACDLGCDEDEAGFDEIGKMVANVPPPRKDEKKRRTNEN